MSSSISTEIAKLQVQLFQVYLQAQEAEVKKYDADWLKDGKTIYRQGGRFASPKSAASAPSVSDVSTVDTSVELKPYQPNDATVSVDDLAKTGEFKAWEGKQKQLDSTLDKAAASNPNFVEQVKQFFTKENLDKMKKDLANLYGDKSQEIAKAIKDFDFKKTIEDFKGAVNTEEIKNNIKGLAFQAGKALEELATKVAEKDFAAMATVRVAGAAVGVLAASAALVTMGLSITPLAVALVSGITLDLIALDYTQSNRFASDMENVKNFASGQWQGAKENVLNFASSQWQGVKEKTAQVGSMIMANETVKAVLDKATQGKQAVDKKVKELQAMTESASQKLNKAVQDMKPIVDAIPSGTSA